MRIWALRSWTRPPLLVTLALICATGAIGAAVIGQSLSVEIPALLDPSG